MNIARLFSLTLRTAGVAVALALFSSILRAQQDVVEPVYIGPDDIGGVVRSSAGPEAGVWVIAETTELPTKFAKIVVTDERGQYLVPGLPRAHYAVWVRGYGLVDSQQVRTVPGNVVILRAQRVLNAQAAAQYPKSGSGQAMTQMAATTARIDPKGALEAFPDWTDRIAAGELPLSQPTRPQGIERNVVVSMWDWAGPNTYLHNEIATDRRNPPATALAEIYEPPLPGYSPRGMDIDRNGVVWTSLASGHLASFDRRKCKGPLNGPAATGRHCPEGWTLYPFPRPQFEGVTDSGSAEASYYTWVDQHNTFGLGRDVPIVTGNANESLLALVAGKWISLRVPYPMGFYAKGIDGRIDDANAGWKGRGLWTTYGDRTPFHLEGGKGTTNKVVKLQLRPNPLAR